MPHRIDARPEHTVLACSSSDPSPSPSPSSRRIARPPGPDHRAREPHVLGTPLAGPWPEGTKTAVFGLGCFWGDEKDFWQLPGVVTTAVGYAGGSTPNPTYRRRAPDRPDTRRSSSSPTTRRRISYEQLLASFWEHHDPTQGMRQGNDIGSQYRSIIIVDGPEQRALAEASKAMFQERLTAAGYGQIATEIVDAAEGPFYYAEDYHQQYLDKNPAATARTTRRA